MGRGDRVVLKESLLLLFFAPLDELMPLETSSSSWTEFISEAPLSDKKETKETKSLVRSYPFRRDLNNSSVPDLDN